MRRLVALGLALLWADCALAQPYPNHPIRIIVPTPAGGPVDVMARLIGNALPATLGQSVVVENRPGAGNTIGSRAAAAADPDGYTLMVSAASGLIMSPMIYKNAGYDAASFAPVALIAETPQVLVINPQLPLKSVAELIAYAKANPGKLNYSTGGTGTLPHLTAELFKKETGTQIVHVPYKGGGPSLTAVIAGEVQMTFDTLATSLQLIESGKLRALAVVAPKRSPELPDVPTMAEARLSGAHQRRLDRAAGAARHAARHHRQAQRRHQCGARRRADEERAGQARRAAARRHAAGARRSHRARAEEVDADRAGAQSEGGVTRHGDVADRIFAGAVRCRPSAQIAPGADRAGGLSRPACRRRQGRCGRDRTPGQGRRADRGARRLSAHAAACRRLHAQAGRGARLAVSSAPMPNALEAQKYDIVTIAAVADDVPMLKLALAGGGRASNITSPYEGTALIAAAHLGHDEVVRTLIAAKAPLDHVNNLGWTALIESIVLGDGGKRHVACLDGLGESRRQRQSGRPRRQHAADAGARARL